AFLSYAATKRFSKAPEKLGTGAPEGIAATESANSAVSGANLIPLLTLGIPGNLTAALLVGAFLIHGVTPGPLIFQRDASLIYGLFAAMIMQPTPRMATALKMSGPLNRIACLPGLPKHRQS
ncbi:MAG: tripartite tricarboxylate transporter permease, partial [Pseudomonadota bacterium]